MDNDSQTTRAELGKPAPDFSLPDLDDEEHSLGAARGKIAILNFWSAECGWSERVDRELAPALARWGKEVVFYPIAANDNEQLDVLCQVSQEHGLPLVLFDADQEVADLYGALNTPHFFVIDRDGILRYRGAFDDVSFRQRKPTQAYLIPAVDALLSGHLPDPAETPTFGCTIVRYTE
jgi:peroxiredoxin